MNSPDTIGQLAAESAADKIAYVAQPHFYTSPIRIRAAAHLYGVETPALDRARVLELGCGNGGNLLPFALAYPGSTAVGIDLWTEPIQQGNGQIHDLALKNLSLHALPFTSIDQSIGQFDYIIVHDAFTWAPSAIREAILRICRENLSDNGIAYIGTHTYPGWKAGDTLRDLMQMHSHAASTLTEAVNSAVATLGLMSDGLAPKNADAIALKALVERFREHPDYYINAEFLQSEKTSFYFVEFAGAAMQAGLAYVGDAEPQDELSATYGPNTQLNHSLLAMGQPKVMRQQYLDFSVGRQLHKSLFVRVERTAEIQPTPELARLVDLHWACKYSRTPPDSALSKKKAHFKDAQGSKLYLDDQVTISVVNALSDAWPLTLSFEALKAATLSALESLNPDSDHSELVQQALKTLFLAGTVRYSLDKGPYNTSRSTCLTALPGLACTQEHEDAPTRVTGVTLWHDDILLDLDRPSASVLSNLDGDHTPAQLVTNLRKTLFTEESDAGEDDGAKRDQSGTDRKVIQTVDFLRQVGALTGSRSAWTEYFAAALLADQEELFHALGYVDPLVMFSSQGAFGGLADDNQPADRHTQTHHSRNGAKNKAPSPSVVLSIAKLKYKEQFREIEPIARELTIQFPSDICGWSELGMALVHMGNIREGTKALLTALSLEPTHPTIHTNFGMALQKLGLIGPAVLSLSRALRFDPQNFVAWNYLGNAYRSQDKTWDSALCLEHALKINPKFFDAYNNLANVCAEQMRPEEAVKNYRRALELRPDYFQTHSNLLFTLTHDETVDPVYLFEEHRRFGLAVERAAKNLNPKPTIHRNSKDPERTLRVGFVSGDLRAHAVANFLEPIWKIIDKGRYELYAYSTGPKEDATSKRLKTYVHKWTPSTGMSDRTLADTILSDHIDILFDLSGHTGYNRLPMFALKPAPIQVSWIGYPGTTGLLAMDYRIVNKHFAPPGLMDAQFTEKLLHLPSATAFRPAADSPAVNALPALHDEYFTYGSFNRVSKAGEAVFALWADILKAVPKSRLLLGNMHGSAMTQEITARFAQHDIEAERLILCDRVPTQKYLQLHHKVDVLLDTFPYAGGTTTNHGLWMGVPTITLAGKILAGRAGAAIMSQYGLTDFVANSPAEYLQQAIDWANKREALSAIRSSMRDRIENNPTRSHEFIAKSVEHALRKIWETWCDGKSPESFEIEIENSDVQA